MNQKAVRVRIRYQYYEMKQKMRKISAIIPPEFSALTYSLGWCAKAVDSLADRIVPDGFDRDIMQIDEIFRLNNADILYDSAVLSALISSCCFLYIGWNQANYPTLQVIDGGNATGIIDPVTNLLTEGYAILKRGENGTPEQEAYFLNRIVKLEKNDFDFGRKLLDMDMRMRYNWIKEQSDKADISPEMQYTLEYLLEQLREGELS